MLAGERNTQAGELDLQRIVIHNFEKPISQFAMDLHRCADDGVCFRILLRICVHLRNLRLYPELSEDFAEGLVGLPRGGGPLRGGLTFGRERRTTGLSLREAFKNNNPTPKTPRRVLLRCYSPAALLQLVA